MPRLAWFTPLPPIKSGIVQYSCELLPALVVEHEIDLFVDGRPEQVFSPDARIKRFSAYDFLWKNRERPYDLIVYQLGNAPCHDYMWPYLVLYPGLVVLHDGQLHHARGRMLMNQWHPRHDDYRREFWFNHPDAPADAAELGAAGLLGSMTYLWPMLRVVVDSSRRVLVHNEWLGELIREAHPQAAVDVVEMGVTRPAPRSTARREVRTRYGIAEDAVVFTAFGKVTPEKRVREMMRALASVAEVVPQAHLLVAGETVDYYDMKAEAEGLRLSGRVTLVGYLPDEQIDDYLAASDVCVCMRWPTSRETSASWLRCLAAGKPTISTDLLHTVDVPTLDPRSWSVLAARLKPDDQEITGPVGVSIDIVDEHHSLKLAMRRLAADAPLRTMLGENAQALWNQRWRVDQMASGYRDAIDRAVAHPAPESSSRAGLPTHLMVNGTELTDRLLHDAGLSDVLDSRVWKELAE
ncbi:MAG: glycosyltransferase family 4 protein [Vicinamibacterales bacterium]